MFNSADWTDRKVAIQYKLVKVCLGIIGFFCRVKDDHITNEIHKFASLYDTRPKDPLPH